MPTQAEALLPGAGAHTRWTLMFLPILLLLSSCAATRPAPPAAPLPADDGVFRVAFGSCAHQNKPLPILTTVVATRPDVFVWLGDNIYGDTDDMTVLSAKYEKLADKPEFQVLQSSTQVRSVWDDHDYGRNDAGSEYPHRAASEKLFLDFWGVPADSDRRAHPGIYGAEVFTDGAHTVQLILLDTRYFRGPLEHRVRGDGYKNDYRPRATPGVLLGEAQWSWLSARLAEPADVRIVASSIQFGHDYNGWESWTNFPSERARMVRLLREAAAGDVIFISGDVHWGEISRYDPGDGGPPLYDVTSSGLTQSWPTTEPNSARTGPIVRQNNFGVIDIDWPARTATMQLRLEDGSVASESKLLLSAP